MANRTRRLLLASAALVAAAPALHAADTATIPGNVAAWVAAAPAIGTPSDSKAVAIVVHMALRHRDELKQVADEVSKPGSPMYGHYLTPSTFRSEFAPAAEDVAAVAAMLTRAGMSVITVGPANAYVSATATVGQLRSAFGVTQKTYRYGAMALRANREAPRVPAAMAGKILYIEGLDDTTFLKQPLHRSVTVGAAIAPANLAAAAVTPPPVAASNPSPYCDTYFGDLKATLSTKPGLYDKTLPWLICGYTPAQVQAAYGFDKVKYDGAGVTVAFIDAYASPTLQADGNKYAKNHDLPSLTAANFKQIIPTGIYDVPAAQVTNAYGWWEEQSLDLAAIHGSAPGASIVYVGSTDNGTALTVALLNTIYNKQAEIITNSYGNGGEAVPAADVAMEDQAFMAAAAEGITVLFSSGDDGDLSQLNGVASGSWEATSAYVTGVGGTSLGVKNAAGNKIEYGWGNYRDLLADATVNSSTSITTSGLTTTTAYGLTFADFTFYAGSGGGISLLEAQPAYQATLVSSALATTLNEASGDTVTLPTPMRVSPDVAMVGDPYTGYLFGETFTIAGSKLADSGCTKSTATTEYCENDIGGTSLSSPLMAGTVAVLNQARLARGKAVVGFANPLFYSIGMGTATNYKAGALNAITPPTTATAVLRGYAADLNEVRVVTINSVPTLIITAPFALQVCSAKICEGLDDVFNYTSPGYNDVTGLGVPYLPNLVKE